MLFQTISFVYIKVIEFPENELAATNIVTKNFFSNISNIMYEKINLHHSNVTDEKIKITFPCLHTTFSALTIFHR